MALGISVWLIYTADHLWDARKNENPCTLRHAFHQHNFIVLSVVWVVVASIGGSILFFLPLLILKLGGVLLFVVVLYFLMLYFWAEKSALIKEFVIALLYTMGIFIPPIGTGVSVQLSVGIWLFSLYFLLAFINVLIFTLYDESDDRIDGHSSIVISFGKKNVILFTKILLTVGLMVLLIGRGVILYDYVFFMMFLILGSLLFFQDKLRNNGWYRILGDGIFILPVISWWV